ncbi:hypothetical protein, partial [Salmonella sp. s51228]|uniref:hypothetical protein n=1 Tax=Salmonella sp. s51228 TaxID=3159652 RepID=UPI003980F894
KASVDGAQFYTNRILNNYRGKDQTHVDWVQALIGSLKSLQEYVENYHKSGLAWNPSGAEIKPGSVPTTTAVTTSKDKPVSSVSDVGIGSTHQLKKVDDSQKTHKNP